MTRYVEREEMFLLPQIQEGQVTRSLQPDPGKEPNIRQKQRVEGQVVETEA